MKGFMCNSPFHQMITKWERRKTKKAHYTLHLMITLFLPLILVYESLTVSQLASLK